MNISSDVAVQLEKKVISSLSQKDYKGALAALRELIRMKPYDLDLQLRTADLLAEMKQYDKAIAVYQRVAENYARTGQPLKALKVAKAIQKIDPTFTDITDFMAARYAGRGKEETEEFIPPPPPEESALEIPAATEVEEEYEELAETDYEEEAPPQKRHATAQFEPPQKGSVSPPLSESLAPPPPEALPADINLATFEEQFSKDTNQVLENLPRRLPKIPLFSDMGKTAFKRLLDEVDHIIVQPGSDVVVEGERGDSLYIILEGSVEILKIVGEAEVPLAELGPGDFFGEMALLGNTERQATVRAIEECELLCLSKKTLAAVGKKSPSVISILHKNFRQRLLKNMLKTSPLFEPFDHKTRKELIENFKHRRVGKGEVIIEEGTKSDGLYLIMIGEMAVKKKSKSGKQMQIATLKPGDVFGEISLLTQGNTIATVQANRPSEILRLPAKVFTEIILTHPQVLEYVSRLSESRIADTERKYQSFEAKPVKTTAIV
ncbi:MAG: hypothetical protein Kow0090_06590 [Myxococcota bacterium]